MVNPPFLKKRKIENYEMVDPPFKKKKGSLLFLKTRLRVILALFFKTLNKKEENQHQRLQKLLQVLILVSVMNVEEECVNQFMILMKKTHK
jgi:hypothetical protein